MPSINTLESVFWLTLQSISCIEKPSMAFVAEAFTSAAVGFLLTQFGTPAFKKITSSRRVKKEVIRLENTLNTIKGMLPHAEQLQATNCGVRSWLRHVKDLAYEAEDIIDDYLTDARRRQLGKQENLFKRVRYSPSSAKTKFISPFKTVGRIKEVEEKLRRILANQAVVGLLRTGVVVGDQENSGFVSGREREQTHSDIPKTEVFGRDSQREAIVTLLLDSNEQDDLTTIPIQGMGGIGKTTLAKLVFNDKRVIDQFKKPRMWWVCVSDSDKNFSVQKLTTQIIEAASGSKCHNLDMEQLMIRLHKQLEEDKFLLVLDDVWNEDIDKWENFRRLLLKSANGSKIIVTTRNVKVGSMMMKVGSKMKTISPYELSELPYKHCWELFKRRACIKQEEQFDPELLQIGRDIIKKCRGVPLAAETLGGLCFEANKQKWESVRDNDLWNFPEETNGILRALRISYNYLPPDLKQCFAFCSVFPKNYEIKKDMLVASWITLGYIHSLRDMQSLEDIGNEFVEILMQASLIKLASHRDRLKMHDLVHDLAKFVAGEECFNICNYEDEKIPKGVRHLFCSSQVSSSAFEAHCAIPEPSKLRTLILVVDTELSFNHIHETGEFLFLRVLHFENHRIESLPDSIGKLKHLRYLTIRGEKLKELPESITDLHNLEILDIFDLSLQKLPESIGKLVNLKHIHFFKMSQLLHIPSGLKKLTSLQTLPHFIVSKEKMGCKLNALNELKNLQGSLNISGLENVKSVEGTEKTILSSKNNLERVALEWGIPDDDNVKSQTIGLGVLANLEPHSNLKYFKMRGYVGTSLPPWMMKPSLSLNNIVEIQLANCHKCQQLPPLGLLPALAHLDLRQIEGARYFDQILTESQKDFFPSLETLFIEGALNLEGWVSMESWVSMEHLVLSFPRLITLQISGCPNLTYMPELPSVKKLELSGVSDLLLQSIFTPNMSMVHIELKNIERCQQLPPFSILPFLDTFTAKNMPDLQYFEGKLEKNQKEWFPSLTYLYVSAENLKSWIPMEKPENEGFSLSVSFPCLLELEIHGCPRLKNMPLLPAIQKLHLGGINSELVHSVLNPNYFLVTLRHLVITDCMDLEYLPKDGLQCLVSLTDLWISNCESLTSLSLTGNGMSHLTSLQTLQLQSLPKLVCLPQELETLTALEHLHIKECKSLSRWSRQKLTSLQYLLLEGYCEHNLPVWMANFTSLQGLTIYDCRNLQFLPEWVLSVDTTIKGITIDGCPHLAKRYSKPTGEDWQKIAHIESRLIAGFYQGN